MRRAYAPGRLALAIASALTASPCQLAAAADDEATALETVEVVGSRIRRVDLETSLPVFTLEREQLERTGLMSVGDILQDLTTHGAALNTTFNNGGNGETRIDLRNLGSNRTLVLVNGRRWITGIEGAVDLNSIPLAIIERIDVLKDGASALYGSDAIAGVINITTREDYDGAEATAHFGENESADGRVEAYEFTVGSSGERASVALNVSHLKQEPISAGDREISAVPTFGLPANNVFIFASPTSPFGRFGFGSRGNCPFDPTGAYPANGRCTAADNRPPAFNRSTFDPATGTYRLFDPATDGYNFAPENYLQTPQERTALYLQGRYELTEAIGYSFEALYNERRSAQELAPVPLTFAATLPGIFGFTVPVSNVYNPFGQPVTALSIRPGVALRRLDQDADTFRFGGGFDGAFDAFDRAFVWDANYAYSDFSIAGTARGVIDTTRLREALGPSFRDAGGVPRCGVPAAVIPGCVPFDPFRGPAALTPEMLDYVYFTAQERTRTRAWNYSANLNGDLATLPAGPVAFAAGYEYRREAGEDRPDALAQQDLVLQGRLPDASFGGRTSVGESYLELSIPLVADAPYAEVLELSLAGRRSDYESFGATTNFKGGFRWKPFEQLLLRGSHSEGFRAPNVSELFFPARIGVGVIAIDDPCLASADGPSPAIRPGCAADGVPGGAYTPSEELYRFSFGGNPDLQPETAVSKTLGLVWNPPWLPGFDLTLDWYRIEIDDAISAAVEIVSACVIQGVPEACARTTRNSATGELLFVDNRILNSGALSVEGYDLTARYRRDTSLGRFTVVWDSTYNVEYSSEVPRGVVPTSATGNYFQNEPAWRVRSNLDLAWERGDWDAAAGARYYSALDESCSKPAQVSLLAFCSKPDVVSAIFFGAPENRIDSRWYFDVQASWNAPWEARVSIGVQNVLDEDPPVSFSAFANSFDPAYPVPGRHWYVGYTQKF